VAWRRVGGRHCATNLPPPPPSPPLPSPPLASRLQRHIYAYAKGFLEGLGVRKGTTVAVWMGDEAESVSWAPAPFAATPPPLPMPHPNPPPRFPQFVVQSACAVLGAHVAVVDPAAPVSALLPVLASHEVRALFISPRVGGESRTEALSAALEPEFEPFARSAVWGYAPLVSKRLRSLKFVVHSGFDAVDGMVRLSDLPVHGAGESR
jgi:acyl-CoA synthetase (AMP-forming)/AMP-acid ligase II